MPGGVLLLPGFPAFLLNGAGADCRPRRTAVGECRFAAGGYPCGVAMCCASSGPSEFAHVGQVAWLLSVLMVTPARTDWPQAVRSSHECA
jgi:hypothetical protein